MKNQALFSSKDKSKKLKCRLLQYLFGALRVKKVTVWGSNPVIFIFAPLHPFSVGLHCCNVIIFLFSFFPQLSAL